MILEKNGAMPDVQAVIFDMDGLMFQTEQQIWRAWDEVGESFAGEKLGYHLLNTMGMNRDMRKEYFAQACGADFSYEEFEKRYRARVAEMKATEGIPIQRGLLELLEYLQETGMPHMLSTGSSRDNTLKNLCMTGTEKYFDPDYILCGDDVVRAKPDPFIYQKSCEMLGIRPENALVLEDSVNGVLAAYGAGTPVILIPDLQKDQSAIEGKYLMRAESLLDVVELLKQRNAAD